jgi:hypothetical protein
VSTWTSARQPCPRCRTELELPLARSLNVSRSPESREALLRGTLHVTRCPACEQRVVVESQFDYLDFGRRQLLMIFRPEDEARWAELEPLPAALYQRSFTDEQLPPLVRQIGEGFRVRAVFGMAALREKVVLWEAGLDDAVVETWKLGWMRRDPLARMRAEQRPRADHVEDGRLILMLPDANAPLLWAELAQLTAHPVDEVVRLLSAGPYVDTGRLLLAADEIPLG